MQTKLCCMDKINISYNGDMATYDTLHILNDRRASLRKMKKSQYQLLRAYLKVVSKHGIEIMFFMSQKHLLRAQACRLTEFPAEDLELAHLCL